MAKKRNHKPDTEDIKDYYSLKYEAVDKLVKAEEEEPEQIPIEEQHLVKSGFLAKIPVWVKALFIKFWFAGAACFFFYWGLGIFVQDPYALILILAVSLGVMTDLLTNNIFRFIQSSDKEYSPYMLLPMKKFWTFFVNIIYALVVVLIVRSIYDGLNRFIISVGNLSADSVPLAVEPFLFGLIYLAVDMIFIGIKDLIVFLIKRKKFSH